LPYKKINKLLKLQLTKDVAYLSKAAIEHIKLKHTDDYEICLENISSVICHPDYIGQSPHYKDKYEMVKITEAAIILVAMNALPNAYGNYPVESAYIIAESTLRRRIRTGHLKSGNKKGR